MYAAEQQTHGHPYAEAIHWLFLVIVLMGVPAVQVCAVAAVLADVAVVGDECAFQAADLRGAEYPPLV